MKNNKKDIDKRLDDVLMSFHHLMTELLVKEAKRYNLNLSHFKIIMFVAHKKSVKMKSIASWLDIKPPSVSILVDTLVSKKLLKRVHSDKDRRSIEITLGDGAYKFFEFVKSKKEIVFKKMLDKLNNNDKESLVNVLNKCVNN